MVYTNIIPEFANQYLAAPIINNKQSRHKNESTPYFFTMPSKTMLGAVLKRAHTHFIEADDRRDLSAAIDYAHRKSPHFFLSISTLTAYHAPVAQKLTAALQQRFGLPQSFFMEAETCLQEALLNAVIHGNLGIDSRFQSLSGFERFCELVETRLRKPPYCHRRVQVAFWKRAGNFELHVSDEGDGFRFLSGVPENGLPHGRGLAIVREMASNVYVGDDQRTLCMFFSEVTS